MIGKRVIAIAIVCAALPLSAGATTRSYNGITSEAVDHFVSLPTLNNQANVNTLVSGMETSVNGTNVFSHLNGAQFYDSAVYQTDFPDPEAGFSGNADTYNFDKSSSALSVFVGHGSCSDDPYYGTRGSWQSCTSSSQCIYPDPSFPGGQVNPGRCLWSPGSPSQGICQYNPYSGRMFYGSTGPGGWDWNTSFNDQNLRWGEDPVNTFTNTYGGNGGMNVAVFYTDCTVRPGQWLSQFGTIFNGLVMFQAVMPTMPEYAPGWNNIKGDATILPLYSNAHFNSPSGMAHQAWETAFQNNTGGGYCTIGAAGYQGVFGCGAAVTVTENLTAIAAVQNAQATWGNILSDSWKPSGNGSVYAIWSCNYNCSTYPITR